MATRHPRFAELSDSDARDFLALQHMGRLAYSARDRVDIEPVTFASDREWVFGRTGVGSTLSTLLHHPWCAFEADDVRDPFDWTSVVVKGTFYLLDPEASPGTYRRAVELMRGVVPGTFTPEDPAPDRQILYGIYIHEITGRMARH
jgi:nitroimidazol reductase NimA-like FMN-containing flavoprotein (pyridoxamine 5'-phosphate oxidase superfamily)